MAPHAELEAQIDRWRGYVQRRQAISPADVDELEDHLREQIADRQATGLDDEEAFLVAIKRLGNLDAVSREFAREHSDRLWKQLVLVPDGSDDAGASRVARAGRRPRTRRRGGRGGQGRRCLVRRRRRPDAQRRPARLPVPRRVLRVEAAPHRRRWRRRCRPVRRPGGRAQRLPVRPGGSTEMLAALHAPVVLWLLVGLAYVGGRWRSDKRRMDFVRFTGELAIYYTLLALGGAVLIALTLAMPPDSLASISEPVAGGLGPAVRRPGRPRRRRLARRGQAERRREHRPRPDPGLHAADHCHAAGPSGRACHRGRLRRGRPRPAHPHGRDPGAGPLPAALLDFRPRPARPARPVRLLCSSPSSSRPSRSTP